VSTLHGNHLGNDYVARQYDPALGRFLQADTIVPNPANPQSLNRYSYTLGNPLRYTDPSGHRCEEPELGDPPNVQFHDFSYSAGQDGVTAANSVELLGGQIVDTIGTILALWNFGLDLVEIAAPPGVDQIPAWADLFIATESSVLQGETYWGRPYPGAPEMLVLGQDPVVTTTDTIIGGVSTLVGLLGGAPTEGASIVAGKAIDTLTSSFSALHDFGRLTGKIPTEGAIGIYTGSGTLHITMLDYSPAKNNGETTHVGERVFPRRP